MPKKPLKQLELSQTGGKRLRAPRIPDHQLPSLNDVVENIRENVDIIEGNFNGEPTLRDPREQTELRGLLQTQNITAPPTGAAGGVLDGTYPNPGFNGLVAGFGLDEASDVLSVVLADFNLSGTHAARPAAGTAGRTYFETDTHILYRDSGSAWQATGPGYVYKAATETVNNSTTLQNDDALLFPIEVGEVWQVELFLNLDAPAVPDWKFDWSLPTGVLGVHGALGTPAEGASFPFLSVAPAATPNAVVAIGTPLTIAGAAGGSREAILHAEIRATGGSATAGTCNFQWAQDTLTATNNTVQLRSWMRITRVL